MIINNKQLLSVCLSDKMTTSDWMTGEDLKKLVDPGDIIEFDMGTYSHFGIYVGDQELSPAGSSTEPDDCIKKGDLVHLTKEDNEVVLEYLSEQKNRCRKNNLKESEEVYKKLKF